MMARSQADQDRGIVPARRDDHQLGPVDVNGSKRLIAGCVGFEHGAAHCLGLLQPVLTGVDDDDIFRIGPQVDELLHGACVLGAESGDDDVVAKGALDSLHDEFFPGTPGNESIGRAGEDQQEEDADRRDDDRVEHACPVGDRDDVAVTGSRRADHREIDDVQEADRAVVRVLEALAFDPVDEDKDTEERRHRDETPAEA